MSVEVSDRLTRALADRYRVGREVGAGGMATVYLAQDIKHDRDVAIKVLHPDLGAALGSDRFLSEIKTTARLQHPHILPLIDSGEADGLLYYVMPFVRGETLRARLERDHQLAIADALRIAREVAAALEHAHQQGIIHRDIKPENILLQDGAAVVADFGIALAVQQAGGQRMTQTGLSLGTPQYMSPEQAMGEKTIDARSDIYALGAVTYEMLAGEPPFTGASVQAIVARVLSAEPQPLSMLRKTVPRAVEAITLAALQKLPADRPATAKAFADGLIESAAAPTRATATHPQARGSRAARWPWAVSAALAIALALVTLRTRPTAARAPHEYDVLLPNTSSFDDARRLELTRDGQTLLVKLRDSSGGAVYRKSIGRGTLARVGTAGALDQLDDNMILSPDGKWLAVCQGGKTKKVAMDGSAPAVTLADAGAWCVGTWTSDGHIIHAQSYQSGLSDVPEDGGAVTVLTTPNRGAGELGHWWPHVLPDDDHVLFTNYRSNLATASIDVVSRKSGVRKRLVEEATGARYVASAKLLFFVRAGTLFGVPFDADRVEVTGKPVALLNDVAVTDGTASASYAIADNGTLAYLPLASAQVSSLPVLLDRSGRGGAAIENAGLYEGPALAPGKDRIALNVREPNGVHEIWTFPVGSGPGTRITRSAGNDWGAAWTPDGRSLVYTSEVRGFYALSVVPVDGSQPPRTLLSTPFDHDTPRVSADGRLVIYTLSLITGTRVGSIGMAAGAQDGTYADTSHSIARPDLSPDGRWITAVVYEQGQYSVYVQSFPDPSLRRVRISGPQGDEPLFTRGGREVVYRVADSVFAAPFDPATGQAGPPVRLFFGPYASNPGAVNSRSWDASRDGESFLMLKQSPDRYRRHVVVILDWLDDAVRRMKP